MIKLGISEGYHDAAFTYLDDSEIIIAGHSERYTRIKNCKFIDKTQYAFLPDYDKSAFYEKPFLKNIRRFFGGQKLQWPRWKHDYYF